MVIARTTINDVSGRCISLDARDECTDDPNNPQILIVGSTAVPIHQNKSTGHLTNPDRSTLNEEDGMLIISVLDDSFSSLSNPTFLDSTSSPFTRSAMSLRASEACSSISSLFTSSQSDMLNHANTSVSDEEENISSQYSEEDFVVVGSTHTSSSRVSKNCDDDDELEALTNEDEASREAGINHHDFSTLVFEAIGMSLEQQHDSNPSPSEKYTCNDSSNDLQEYWLNANMTEDKLDKFVQAASEILPFLNSPPQIKRKIPMPPLPPKGHEVEDESKGSVSSSQTEILSALPPEFICLLCTEPIVGATTLDCGCTECFCLSCIERHSTKSKLENEVHCDNYCAEGKCSSCPLCHAPCRHTPCLPLDNAIIRAVTEVHHTSVISAIDKKLVKSFQAKYYLRLLNWHVEVKRRYAKQDQEEEHARLLALHEYARNEDAYLKKRDLSKTKKAWYGRAVEVLLLVTPVLFFGVRALIRKR